MLKAHNENSEWVSAKNAIRNGNYRCPECNRPLVPVLGSTQKTDYFAHYPGKRCPYASEQFGETMAHSDKKMAILSAGIAVLGANNIRMEYRLEDGQRPDVYFERNDGQRVAIEIQHSPISDKDLIDRIASYSSKRVASIWMPDGIKDILNTAHADGTGLARVRPYMRRIAKLTDDVAYDHYSGETVSPSEVVSIGLIMKRQIRTDGQGQYVLNADGNPIMDTYWPMRNCQLFHGSVRVDTDSGKHKLALWIPRPVSGESLVSARPKRQMTRREVVDDTGAFVDCNRARVETDVKVEPIEYLVSPARSDQFQDMLWQFWSEHDELSLDERMAMMGFK